MQAQSVCRLDAPHEGVTEKETWSERCIVSPIFK